MLDKLLALALAVALLAQEILALLALLALTAVLAAPIALLATDAHVRLTVRLTAMRVVALRALLVALAARFPIALVLAMLATEDAAVHERLTVRLTATRAVALRALRTLRAALAASFALALRGTARRWRRAAPWCYSADMRMDLDGCSNFWVLSFSRVQFQVNARSS